MRTPIESNQTKQTKGVAPKCDFYNYRFDNFCLQLIMMDDYMQLFEQK